MKNKDKPDKANRSIKSRLVGAVLIPSVALVVLWTVAASYLVFDAIYVKLVVSGVREVSIPAVTALASAQKERQLGTAFLSGSTNDLSLLHDQEQQTDKYLASMKTAADALAQNAPPPVVQGLQKLNASIDQLPKIRAQVDSKTIDKQQVFDFYNTMLDSAWSLFDTQARILPAVTVSLGGVTSAAVFRATDLMSRSATLISGAFAAGTLDSADHLEYANLVASYHSELTTTVPFVQPDIRDRFNAMTASADWKQLVDFENGFIEHGAWTRGLAGLPTNQAAWLDLTNRISDQMVSLTLDQADEVSSQAISDANSQLTLVVIGSVVALLVAIGAIVAAVRVSRNLVDRTLVTRLARLREEALQLAQHRLPDIVRRLREGQAVNVRSELPDLDYGRDEIGQVADAFNAAQYTAVTAAVTEAQARDGVHNVFLSIAHRNQGLVHRQLKILDTMERGEENPQQLERLFQLDHLATRARRNAENLIILGGELPGRRWRKPVKLVDVLRAAVSETELYHRVQVERGPDVSVVGSAVADTIHLIAELVDNATSFSPPRSQVLVSSTLVARGAVVEVEDQGLGMSEEDRERANRMMANSPEFDAMALKTDSRLGLFVIARLANRLEINVEFRVSPYGGTRAIVLLPSSILATSGPADRAPDAAPLTHHEMIAAESETAAERESSELDEFWALSRSRLADKVQTTESLHGALDPTPPGADIAERLTPANSDALPIPTATTRWPDAEDVDEAPTPVPLVPAPPMPAAARPVLPQRQPQHNLAPQLRGDLEDEPEFDLDDDTRSPEEIRHTMSAFQAGSLKGRQAGEFPDSRA
ncbi:sensor histidine kinase [Kutzneria kofuensis]|uniref:histidine kinase n=1 Tax=Kutzneria kofuensis TaxID=103725 RepID=A0A7W9NFP1_9PSEU|nr:nitrate- and nitrite sensing domain-containing protein [Kutzneria kofuensis]MBB5890316.1 signal transduction histidine kinase [Kutzneria kofuensis]